MKTTLLGGLLAAVDPRAPVAEARPAEMPRRPLGRTGFHTSLFGLGCYAALHLPDKEVALAILETALALGVNYYDTGSKYGPSEAYLGEAFGRRRKQVFLATKTLDRTRDGALRDLEQSLKALRTDHVDLWMHHQLDATADLEAISKKGGAAEAFATAREQKMVRFTGVTGHRDPAVLKEAFTRYNPEVVLLPSNLADRHHLSFLDGPVHDAIDRQMGVVGMKVYAQGRIFKQGFSAKEAFDYAASQPVSTVIIGCDSVEQVRQNAELARAFRPLAKEAQVALEERSHAEAKELTWFKLW